MPELLAHTNMDAQAMSKLRDHIEEFVRFLAKHPEYISNPYESGKAYRRAFNQPGGGEGPEVLPFPGPPGNDRTSTVPRSSTKQKDPAMTGATRGVSSMPAAKVQHQDEIEDTPTPGAEANARVLDVDTPTAAIAGPKRRGRPPRQIAPNSPAPTPTPVSTTPKRRGRPPKRSLTSQTPDPATSNADTKGDGFAKRKLDSLVAIDGAVGAKKVKGTPAPKALVSFSPPATTTGGRRTRQATKDKTAAKTSTPTPSPAVNMGKDDGDEKMEDA